jgi:hypothetical protein
MTFDQILAFALFAFAISITPGPNNTMVLASGANFGLWPTIPHLLGIDLGLRKPMRAPRTNPAFRPMVFALSLISSPLLDDGSSWCPLNLQRRKSVILLGGARSARRMLGQIFVQLARCAILHF